MRQRGMIGQPVTEGQVDWGRCSVVETVPDRLSGTPVLKGTRTPVQGILDNYDDGLTPAEVAETFDLPLDHVIAILDYREKHYD